ncbi:hypothetical protein C0V72_01375 [Porphyrobacter sp. TH134]|uniref:hypothetical protein n=1 Tax=Porphyrobacter sp. TH134 TaxID=2067450 RepID=UPI000C7B8F33|nr:hypothetical protein [Porphyrobacter sp. TH134]PLK25313.1 hypothetical protein C0V72_01375 [Porphyrobacter sp. TH134]
MRTIVPIAGALALLAAATPAAGNALIPPFGHPATDPGQTVETQVMGDFNGDGHGDLAYIVRGEDQRFLRVVTSMAGEFDLDTHPPQMLSLDPYPLADGTLTLRKNVLLLEDLTGGTTAVASTHRFRWDPKLGAMRLIGLDATLYSRTFAHDGSEASWNVLTGDLVTRTLKLGTGPGDAAYTKTREKRVKRPSKPLRLEQSPGGDELLGWPGAQ